MSFLPEGYKEPATSSKYLKMKEPGKYRLRILDSPLTAFCGFTDKKGDQKPKPVRSIGNDPKFWIENGVDPQKARHVWILPVWNYALGCVQVWEMHQKSLRDPIRTYAENPKWGHPSKYDIEVTRTGTGMDDTEWTVIAEPHSPIPPEAQEAWDQHRADGFDVTRLLDGGDPFGEGIPF